MDDLAPGSRRHRRADARVPRHRRRKPASRHDRRLLGLGLALAVALTPRGADPHVSVAIGLPGFGFVVGGPPAVVYTPPPVEYALPVYYRPYYPHVVYERPYFHDRGRHRGWYKHDWDDEDDD